MQETCSSDKDENKQTDTDIYTSVFDSLTSRYCFISQINLI